ncbi:hypothetical protein RHMOL_Rhmol05G0298500 [Rhododendron molle]|uniref:Uncharacterized protein n=1 Tax=Rhododendron molle TaxID=49168 RepID=A0ACC0NW41_RHOML|nr:hypothetical protein RHMOL_Rhmol05G0298500 [Rhododendron molle]
MTFRPSKCPRFGSQVINWGTLQSLIARLWPSEDTGYTHQECGCATDGMHLLFFDLDGVFLPKELFVFVGFFLYIRGCTPSESRWIAFGRI